MAARFLAWVVAWSLGLWALLAAATVYTDPAGLRATERTRTCAPMHMWKGVAFERSGARTVFVGTSRVALGMDAAPAGPLGAAFNLALPAATMPQVARMASWAMERSADRVLVGIDYGMFTEAREGRDAAPAAKGWPSRDEMRQAVNLACTAYEFDPASGTVGSFPAPMDIAQGIPLELVDYARCAAGACDASYRKGLAALRALVRDAVRSRKQLIVFTNPLPALHLEGLRLAGAGTRFERWKRDVARVVREEGGEPVRDFAVYSGESAGANFMDIAHYSRALGQIVQQRLVAAHGDGLFGAPLEPRTIEAHLQRDRAARTAWIARHPAEMADLRRRVARLH